MTSWSPNLLTGQAEIDAHHQELFSRLEKFHAAMLRGARAETRSLLEYLESYVRDHFSAEEKVMRETSFPDYEEHRLEHQAFATTCRLMWARLEAKGASAALMIDAKEWIAGWAARHISKSDASLAVHLREVRGAGPPAGRVR